MWECVFYITGLFRTDQSWGSLKICILKPLRNVFKHFFIFLPRYCFRTLCCLKIDLVGQEFETNRGDERHQPRGKGDEHNLQQDSINIMAVDGDRNYAIDATLESWHLSLVTGFRKVYSKSFGEKIMINSQEIDVNRQKFSLFFHEKRAKYQHFSQIVLTRSSEAWNFDSRNILESK